MRLSGLQNPQAARPVAPVSTARPGNIPGWRLTPYPGYTLTTTIGPVARTRRPGTASGMQRAMQLPRHRRGNRAAWP